MLVPDWNDLRLLLELSRAGSMIRTAHKLGVDHSTVSRRLSALEASVGVALVERSPRGVILTSAGEALVARVLRMEEEIHSATIDLAERGHAVAGTVRLVTPEAFGTYLVAPHVHRLHARHPELELELVPESRTVSLSRREADIAITLEPPERGRLAVRRLVDYRIGLFASREFLDRAGPIGVDNLHRQPFISYIDEMIDLPQLRMLDQVAHGAPVPFRSSSITAQHAAVAGGLGLGLLHVFAVGKDAGLVRILPQEIEIMRSYWMLVHADQQRAPRVRAVIDFLQDLIDGQRQDF